MKIYNNPPKTEWEALCKRGGSNNEEIKERVAQILSRVKTGGEAAVREITEEIDGFCPAEFEVSEAEYDVAAAKVSNEVKDAIEVAYSNIYKFHNAQKRDEIKVETTPGVVCIQRPVAIKRVGLYIPDLCRMAAGETRGPLRAVFLNLYRELTWQKLPDADR